MASTNVLSSEGLFFGVSASDMFFAAAKGNSEDLKKMVEASFSEVAATMAAQEAVFLAMDPRSGLKPDDQVGAINCLAEHVGISRQLSVESRAATERAISELNGHDSTKKVASAVAKVFDL